MAGVLTFPKRQISDSKSLQTTISVIFENGRKLFKQMEKIVGQGEIARYEQFLPFPRCFQKTCTADT